MAAQQLCGTISRLVELMLDHINSLQCVFVTGAMVCRIYKLDDLPYGGGLGGSFICVPCVSADRYALHGPAAYAVLDHTFDVCASLLSE